MNTEKSTSNPQNLSEAEPVADVDQPTQPAVAKKVVDVPPATPVTKPWYKNGYIVATIAIIATILIALLIIWVTNAWLNSQSDTDDPQPSPTPTATPTPTPTPSLTPTPTSTPTEEPTPTPTPTPSTTPTPTPSLTPTPTSTPTPTQLPLSN